MNFTLFGYEEADTIEASPSPVDHFGLRLEQDGHVILLSQAQLQELAYYLGD